MPAPVPVQSGNPAGAIASREYLEHALELADRHDFVIAADECYAEIYSRREEPAAPAFCRPACRLAARSSNVAPCSIACRSARAFRACARGSSPGMPALMSRFLLYRTYHEARWPCPHSSQASTAWNEDTHAAGKSPSVSGEIRARDADSGAGFNVTLPAGAFYLWPDVGGDDEAVHPGFVHFAET